MAVDVNVGIGKRIRIERVHQVVRRQPQQRAGDRLAAERGEHDLAEGAQIRRRQLGQLAADHGLDLGVTDERGEPRMRVEPLAVGAQKLLQRGEPVEVVEIRQCADLGRRPVVGQAGEQRVVVRRVVPGELRHGVKSVLPAGRRGQHRALHRVEPVVGGQQTFICQQRLQVWVGQQVPAYLLRRRNELERRSGDDRHLSEARAHRVEQVGVAVRRTGDLLGPCR